jgi:Tfp pilus assembly protein PilW
MRRKAYLNDSGFSLIEALVAGILSVIVLLAVVSLFFMNNQQIMGSSVRSKTRLQYQTVVDEIGRNVRAAAFVENVNPDLTAIGTQIASEVIYLFDNTGTLVAGYQRTNPYLKEWSGGAFVPFRVGKDTVRVTPLAGAGDTAFTISANRKNVQLKLDIYNVNGAQRDTFFSQGESFKCRN